MIHFYVHFISSRYMYREHLHEAYINGNFIITVYKERIAGLNTVLYAFINKYIFTSALLPE